MAKPMLQCMLSSEVTVKRAMAKELTNTMVTNQQMLLLLLRMRSLTDLRDMCIQVVNHSSSKFHRNKAVTMEQWLHGTSIKVSISIRVSRRHREDKGSREKVVHERIKVNKICAGNFQ
jgi:hypothetical protein